MAKHGEGKQGLQSPCVLRLFLVFVKSPTKCSEYEYEYAVIVLLHECYILFVH